MLQIFPKINIQNIVNIAAKLPFIGEFHRFVALIAPNYA
jgi:hypothetical protein